MGDEMKQTETGMPSLTLEPELVMEPEKEPEVQAPVQLMEVTQEMNPVQQKMAQTVLTPEEQQMVEDFAGKIDLENLTQVMQYGAGTQKKMADFSDEALKNVRSQDLGEVGDLLTGVVGELKGFDAEEEKGLFGFFKKQANKIETLKNRYDKAEANVEKISETLEQHQVRLLKDSAKAQQLEGIKAFLCREFQAESAEIEMIEDKSLIGGFILQADGREFDWSMRGRYRMLQQKLTRR